MSDASLLPKKYQRALDQKAALDRLGLSEKEIQLVKDTQCHINESLTDVVALTTGGVQLAAIRVMGLLQALNVRVQKHVDANEPVPSDLVDQLNQLSETAAKLSTTAQRGAELQVRLELMLRGRGDRTAGKLAFGPKTATQKNP